MRLFALCLCLFLGVQSLQAQTYQRIFRHGDRDVLVIDACQNDFGNTFVLSSIIDTTNNLYGANLTKHDLKGNNEWSRDYVFPDSIEVGLTGEIIMVNQDSLAFTFRTKQNGIDGQVIIKTDTRGASDWMVALNRPETDTLIDVGKTDLLFNAYGGFVTARMDQADTVNLLALTQLDANGAWEWSHTYRPQDTIGNDIIGYHGDIAYEADSNIIATGAYLDSVNRGFYLARFDTLGVPLWSQSYQLDNGGVYVQPLDVQVLNDGSIAVAGTLNSGLVAQGFVAKIAPWGDLQWAQLIKFGLTTPTKNLSVTELTEGVNGSITIGGNILILDGDNSNRNEYLLNLEASSGEINWGTSYVRQNVPFLVNDITLPLGLNISDHSELITSPDGGYAFVNTSQDDAIQFQTPQATPYLVKTDDLGAAICHEEYNLDVDSIGVVTDTLTWIRHDSLVTNGIMLMEPQYPGISAPTLNIPPIEVCPNLPIDTIIDATTVAAIAYEWARGDTTAMIRVMEAGDYPVTVTIDTEACFTLCDTAMVVKIDTLEANIKTLDFDRWCEERILELGVEAMGGREPYMYLWDTGDETEDIEIPESGLNMNYQVTVSDQCGMEVVLTQYVDENHPSFSLPEYRPDMATITFREDVFCMSDEDARIFQLDLSVDDVIPPYDQSTIGWNTGATDDGMTTIFVDGPGEYSVTLVDNCMYEIGDTLLVEIPEPEEIELEIIETECFEQIEMIVTTSGDINESSIVWSTGAGDNGMTIIDVTDYGIEYSATVTDDCNYTLMASTLVNDELEPSPLTISMDQVQTTCGVNVSIVAEAEDIQLNTIVWTPDNGCNGQLDCEYTGTLPNEVFVTFTDICGFTITESIMINPDFEPQPDEITYVIEQLYCDSMAAFVQLTGPEGYDVNSIIWSPDPAMTHAGTSTYRITNPNTQTYTVTLIDQCGLPAILSFDASLDIPAIPEIELVIDTVGYCDAGQIAVSANVTGDFQDGSGNWNPGGINPGNNVLNVNNDSLYLDTAFVYTVLDFCGDIAYQESITFDATSFPPCGICLEWPNIFFPNRTPRSDDDNLDYTFKPVLVNCNPDFLDSYELFIYNGYGNLMFESVNPTSGWNGRVNDDIQPAGVYMFYAEWSYAGIKYTRKGDLTMMR